MTRAILLRHWRCEAQCPIVPRGNKPVAPPTHGLDKLWSVRLIPKRLAQLAHDDRQDCFTHHGLGQTVSNRVSFVTSCPACISKQRKTAKALAPIRIGLPFLPETLISQVQEKWA